MPLALLAILIPFTQIEAGTYTRIRDPKIIVIRSEKDYKAYNDTSGRTIPQPKLDWTHSQLLAIHIGQAPSTGYGVTVKRIVKTSPTAATVEVTQTTPPPGVMQAMHVTYPYAIVKTKASTLTFTLKILKPKG